MALIEAVAEAEEEAGESYQGQVAGAYLYPCPYPYPEP